MTEIERNDIKPSALKRLQRFVAAQNRDKLAWRIGERSRLKPEYTDWYYKLSPNQLEIYRLTRKLTNRQLTKWNWAGCPGGKGYSDADVECVSDYTRM